MTPLALTRSRACWPGNPPVAYGIGAPDHAIPLARFSATPGRAAPTREAATWNLVLLRLGTVTYRR
jgi:hypothetical protein